MTSTGGKVTIGGAATIPAADAKKVADAQAPLTEAESSDTPVEPEGVRVHLDRALGGRYVSIGGGERVWQPEEGAEAPVHETDVLHIDDAELAKRLAPTSE